VRHPKRQLLPDAPTELLVELQSRSLLFAQLGMAALGQKQKSQTSILMSALPQKADML